MVSKTSLTNGIALMLVVLSFFLNESMAKIFSSIGLFALSGSVTNQLAIYMLFEKVPYLYGSGVIPARFEAFKESIKNLMMSEFFTKEQLENFFKSEEKKINLEPLIQESDLSPAFDALTKTVMESSFGSMIGMFGGAALIESLRESFTSKMKNAIVLIVKSDEFNTNLQKYLQSSTLSSDMIKSIEDIIDARLNELTPQMVKEMIHKLINEHLSWLVVWGGVFGGAIGFVGAFLI